MRYKRNIIIFAAMSKKKIEFIMNPISGTVKKAGIPKIIEDTIDKDFFDCTITETRYAGHATEIASAAKDRGVNIVVAVGGDGTINEVGRALINSETAMGIIPCGSGNGLARHLMLPMDIRKAMSIINEDVVHALDYGEINGHPFFCTCGMGFDAFISQKFAEAGKRGAITYIEKVLQLGLKYEPEMYVIESEQGTIKQKAYLISCANASQYGNNAYIAPQASMSDGLLDVTVIRPLDVLSAPQISFDLMNKTLNKNPKVDTFRTDHLTIHREREGVIHYDGDPIMSGRDIEISLHHKAINIVVNPYADKTKRKPNMMQDALRELMNDINAVGDDISKQGRHIQSLNKYLLKKLNK